MLVGRTKNHFGGVRVKKNFNEPNLALRRAPRYLGMLEKAAFSSAVSWQILLPLLNQINFNAIWKIYDFKIKLKLSAVVAFLCFKYDKHQLLWSDIDILYKMPFLSRSLVKIFVWNEKESYFLLCVFWHCFHTFDLCFDLMRHPNWFAAACHCFLCPFVVPKNVRHMLGSDKSSLISENAQISLSLARFSFVLWYYTIEAFPNKNNKNVAILRPIKIVFKVLVNICSINLRSENV